MFQQQNINIICSYSLLFPPRFVVENAFGILVSKFRMYHRVIGISPGAAEACVKASCILHNFMRFAKMREEGAVHPIRREATSTASSLQDVSRMGSNNASMESFRIRRTFCSHFYAEGAVSWQNTIFDI